MEKDRYEIIYEPNLDKEYPFRIYETEPRILVSGHISLQRAKQKVEEYRLK